jgi:murein DD-endopeptidase MepM/ murein hydrolase activator NlpD
MVDLVAPLPNFDVDMPKIDVGGFLPNFDSVTDLFNGFEGSDVFRSFSKSPNFAANLPFFGGSSGGPMGSDLQSFRAFLPSWGNQNIAKTWQFPWSKPEPPPDLSGLHGGSGGVGVASGGFSALNAYDSAFMQAAAAHGGGKFDANWLKAVAMMEGGWGAGAVSGAGAQGIMQIMPGGYPAGERLYPNWRTDPFQNIMLGAYILQQKINENGGSRDMGTQRYLGVGVDPYTGISTTEYLRRIQGYYADLQKTTTGGGAGAPFTGTAGSSYLSIFGGVNYPISSQHAQFNGAPQSWYYNIDDEYGIPVGTHAGLDVAMPNGTALYMPKGFVGTVEWASGEAGYGYDPSGGVARSGPGTGELRIRGRDASGREFTMVFGHMQRIYWTPGQTIRGGQMLGLSGTAGSGAHVHFEYRIPGNTSTGWIAVDPRSYLR